MKKSHIIYASGISFFLGAYLFVAYFLPLQLPAITSSTVVLDKHDQEIGEIIRDERTRHRDIVFEDIPSFYLSGLIWLEDRNFWANNGLSLRGIARSMVHNFQAGTVVE